MSGHPNYAAYAGLGSMYCIDGYSTKSADTKKVVKKSNKKKYQEKSNEVFLKGTYRMKAAYYRIEK